MTAIPNRPCCLLFHVHLSVVTHRSTDQQQPIDKWVWDYIVTFVHCAYPEGGFRNTTCRRFSCLGKRRGLERESFLHTGNSMTLRILSKRRRLREQAFWRKGRSIRTDWRESGALATFARDGFFCWARGENSVSDFCTACRFEFRSRRPLSQLKKGAGICYPEPDPVKIGPAPQHC